MYKLIIFILICTSCTFNVSNENEIKSLNESIDRLNKAFELCDLESLDQLTTTNYTHTNGSFSPTLKNDWMSYLKKRKVQLNRGELEVLKYSFHERKIQLYTNSAWVTGKVKIIGSKNNQGFTRQIRVSNFWVKENDQWKRAGFHDTRIE